jgi:regulator of sigma E protease
MTFVSIVLVIGTIIFFHELGHLVMAKRAGILCREFAIGFGPKIFSFKKGETLYTFRLLPLGGYVRMAGEDPEVIEIKAGHDVGLILNENGQVKKLIINNKREFEEAITINVSKADIENELRIEGYDVEEQKVGFDIDPQAMIVNKGHEIQIAPRDRQFGSKTIGQRAAALFAGPFANFLLAFVLLFGYFIYSGVPVTHAEIGTVLENSPAAEAGLQSGDTILIADETNIDSWREFVQVITKRPDKEIILVIQRNDQQLEVSITPASVSIEGTDGERRGMIGVSPTFEKSFIGAVTSGFTTTIDFAKLIYTHLGIMLTGGFEIDDLAGPVGIIDFTGQMAQQGIPTLLRWTAILSVNVGILNLLPIPALDGGRLMFLGIEAVRGRPLDPQKEGVVHFIGFALLMLLILVVTWNDIQRLFLN